MPSAADQDAKQHAQANSTTDCFVWMAADELGGRFGTLNSLLLDALHDPSEVSDQFLGRQASGLIDGARDSGLHNVPFLLLANRCHRTL
jgi:hypothetical protein